MTTVNDLSASDLSVNERAKAALWARTASRLTGQDMAALRQAIESWLARMTGDWLQLLMARSGCVLPFLRDDGNGIEWLKVARLDDDERQQLLAGLEEIDTKYPVTPDENDPEAVGQLLWDEATDGGRLASEEVVADPDEIAARLRELLDLEQLRRQIAEARRSDMGGGFGHDDDVILTAAIDRAAGLLPGVPGQAHLWFTVFGMWMGTGVGGESDWRHGLTGAVTLASGRLVRLTLHDCEDLDEDDAA